MKAHNASSSRPSASVSGDGRFTRGERTPRPQEWFRRFLGEENLLRLPKTETRIVQPVDLSLPFILKVFVLNCRPVPAVNREMGTVPNTQI
jgi:hypothetical protein